MRWLATALFGGGSTPPLADDHSPPWPASSRRLLQSAVQPAHSKGCSSGLRIAAAGEERSQVIKDPIGGGMTECVNY